MEMNIVYVSLFKVDHNDDDDDDNMHTMTNDKVKKKKVFRAFSKKNHAYIHCIPSSFEYLDDDNTSYDYYVLV